MRSGGYFWAARAVMADKHPERVNAMLKAAAKESESFYGLLARETLGMPVQETLRRDARDARRLDEIEDSCPMRAMPSS